MDALKKVDAVSGKVADLDKNAKALQDSLTSRLDTDKKAAQAQIASMNDALGAIVKSVEAQEGRIHDLEARPIPKGDLETLQQLRGDLAGLRDLVAKCEPRLLALEKHTHPNFELVLNNLKDSLN